MTKIILSTKLKIFAVSPFIEEVPIPGIESIDYVLSQTDTM